MRCGALIALWLVAQPLAAAETLVAVASNFIEPARILAAAFQRETGQALRMSSASSGSLYAQIIHGAPFDILLAASEREPQQLAANGLAVAETRFTYAVGGLVVWSADPLRMRGECEALLQAGQYRRVAIANPALAPYGAAAESALRKWGMWEKLQPELLRAENVAQAFQFAVTGNADLAFVARAQVLRLPKTAAGSYCVVGAEAYPPLRQQAVLLRHGEDSTAARAFLDFLRGPVALAIIREQGYATED